MSDILEPTSGAGSRYGSGREFSMTAVWGPREGTPLGIAPCVRATLTELSTLDAALSDWLLYCREGEMPRPLAELDDRDIASVIAEGVDRLDSRTPDPGTGFSFCARTYPEIEARSLVLHGHVGARTPGPSFINTLILRSEPLCEENASLLTLDLFKRILLVLVSHWRPTWCRVTTMGLLFLEEDRLHRSRRPFFGMAWVSYLSPRFAPMVTPPASVIAERLPDGGLLMTATEDRFDVDNPEHMAAARDIAAALEPVNALPWPPDA